MNRSLIIALMASIVGGALAGGCAGAAKGPADEELVAQTVGAWVSAARATDIDGMMACYSESFEHYEWGGKEGLAAFLQDALDMGYLADMEVLTDEMETEIEEGEASVYPIELRAAFGTAIIELILEKENGQWLITGMTADQY